MMEKLKIVKAKHVEAWNRGEPVVGTLHLSTHHLIYVFCPKTAPANDRGNVTPTRTKSLEKWITYPMILRAVFKPAAVGTQKPSEIVLQCRDFTTITFYFASAQAQDARDAFETIKSLTCRIGGIEKLYAFSYRGTKAELGVNGWTLYDAKAEWKRQGISDKGVDQGWRISTLNADYSFSPTYPASLVVPSAISDNTISYGGKYRSKVRIPALAYLHPVNNCSITRCAQPMTGLRNHRSVQDEKLVAACFGVSPGQLDIDLASSKATEDPSTSKVELRLTPSSTEDMEDNLIAAHDEVKVDQPTVYGAQQHNLIVDARPTVNALAQQAMGQGSENMDNYRFATKAYLGIENIHVMRESLAKVVQAIDQKTELMVKPAVARVLLSKSGWLKHITAILDGSALIARQVGIHHSHCLIHCSDGWDRTSQLSALSQIMLDPYYRTLEGFIVLVEKDWLAFGHMFQHRNGYLNSEKWFSIDNSGMAGSTIPASNEASKDVIGDALSNAKRFFTKKPVLSDEIDSDGEPILVEDLPSNAKHGKGSLASQEATKPKETSPVFHQFLDAVWQLWRQHPTRFEFNARFLKRLLFHVYSCQYGTFLYNSEKARMDARVHERTRSVWDYFLCRREEFINELYDGGIVDDNTRGRERLLFPTLAEVRWWADVFNRSDEEMNGPVSSRAPASADTYSPKEQDVSGSSSIGPGVLTGVESAGIVSAVQDDGSSELRTQNATTPTRIDSKSFAEPPYLRAGTTVSGVSANSARDAASALAGLTDSLSASSIGAMRRSPGKG